MSDCEQTLRELEIFLDGELASDDVVEVRAHLEGCPDCLQAFDFHAELRILIAAKCRHDEVPPDLMARIQECLAAEPDDGRR